MLVSARRGDDALVRDQSVGATVFRQGLTVHATPGANYGDGSLLAAERNTMYPLVCARRRPRWIRMPVAAGSEFLS